MDERVPPLPKDAEGSPEEPAGDDELLEDVGEAIEHAPDEAGDQLPKPRSRSEPPPELTIEEQRRRLQEETGEREGPSRKRRPPGDYKHFG